MNWDTQFESRVGYVLGDYQSLVATATLRPNLTPGNAVEEQLAAIDIAAAAADIASRAVSVRGSEVLVSMSGHASERFASNADVLKDFITVTVVTRLLND